MLRRAKRLQLVFDTFYSQYEQPHFALSPGEWRQIEYLLFILKPFYKFTSLVSRTKDSSIHLVFSIYNRLFNHLEKAIAALRRKKVPWKQLMQSALEAASEKLSKYYKDTDGIDGHLYAISTILSPSQKLQFFSSKEWESDNPSEASWKDIYRGSLETQVERYKERLDIRDSQLSPSGLLSRVGISELESALELNDSQQSIAPQEDELTQYLDSGKSDDLSLSFISN